MPLTPAIPLTDNPDAEQHVTSRYRRLLGAMPVPQATWKALQWLFHGKGSKADENISQVNTQHYPRA